MGFSGFGFSMGLFLFDVGFRSLALEPRGWFLVNWEANSQAM